MLFTLLAEVVVVHVQFTIIYIRHLSFKGLFAFFWRLTRSLIRFQVSFYELFEQFIDREWSESRSLRDGARETEPERQLENEWEYCCFWWKLLMYLLQAHLYHLEGGYGKDCGKYVARP